jgi:predicted lipoprotein with Yx(FWY)xxD motif
MKMKQIVVALTLTALAATASAADVLTGKNGMTLYSFDKDSNGKSACYNQCATIWPPAAVGDASGKDFGETVRTDGSKQLTYKGKPMYYYINDKKAGDTTGDKVNNVWHVVAPTAKTSDAGGYNYGAASYSY